jgi:hypothetical protein
VPDDLHTHTGPRARPVADLPGDALLARAEELARRWVIALIRTRPLEKIGEIPLEELAREAPSLCAQAIRAIQSDVELARLTGRGATNGREGSAPARRLAAIAGARDAAAAAVAVEALRGVLWEALLGELPEPSARQVGDASDRLAHVCAATLAATLEAGITVAVQPSRDELAVAASGSEPAVRDAAGTGSPRSQAIIVDERMSRELPLSSDESPPVMPVARPAEIEIRDERREEGPAAWIKSIGGQLERFEQDGLPFAVLLVELRQIERRHRDELAPVFGRVEEALAATRGTRAGSLTRERPGRYWLLMAETDRAGAHEFAGRLAHAVASCAEDAAVQLEVAIGTAVCPEDGLQAAALAAHADVGLYADRSAVRAAAGPPKRVDEPA